MEFIKHYWTFINEAMSLDKIYDKFYKGKIDMSVFKKLILADPTTRKKGDVPVKKGRYSDWIIKLYINSKNKGRFEEDLYKISDGLIIFHRLKHKLDVGLRDVNKFKSINEFLDATDKLQVFVEKEEEDAEEEAERKARIDEKTIKILDNENYLVVVPKSEESSCYYGQGTRWCTAARESQNLFKGYDRDGNLYIIIDREKNEKYQFHSPTMQFMDEDDSPIELDRYIDDNKEPINAIKEWILSNVVNNHMKEDKEDNVRKLINDILIFSSGGLDERLIEVFKNKPQYADDIPLCTYLLRLRKRLGNNRIGDYMRKDDKDYLVVHGWEGLVGLYKNEDVARDVLTFNIDSWVDYYYTDGWMSDDYNEDNIDNVIGVMKENENVNKGIRKLMIGVSVEIDDEEITVTENNYMDVDIYEIWSHDSDLVPDEVKDSYGQSLASGYTDVVWEHWTNAVISELNDSEEFSWLYPDENEDGGSPELMIKIGDLDYYLEAYMDADYHLDDPDPYLIYLLEQALYETGDTPDPSDENLYPSFIKEIFVDRLLDNLPSDM